MANLPQQGVLFVSNHQTYFADVAAMFHVFSAAKNGQYNTLKSPMYLLNPSLNIYFVAAKETMNAGLLPRIFAYAGAIKVQRTWRSAGKDVKRNVNTSDTDNVGTALEDGWVITFPQGTTRAFNPGRKGTAHIIKNFKPIVVPIVIDGFRRTFDRKGLIIKKKGMNLKMTIKDPLNIDYENDSIEEILDNVMHAIEQSPSFLKVRPHAPSKYPAFITKEEKEKLAKKEAEGGLFDY